MEEKGKSTSEVIPDNTALKLMIEKLKEEKYALSSDDLSESIESPI